MRGRSCADVACYLGQVCNVRGACVADPSCAEVVCGTGLICDAGACVHDPCPSKTTPCDPCAGKVCPNGVCKNGRCIPVRFDPCSKVACPADQKCRDGKCVKELPKKTTCESVVCGPGKFCIDGQCVTRPQ